MKKKSKSWDFGSEIWAGNTSHFLTKFQTKSHILSFPGNNHNPWPKTTLPGSLRVSQTSSAWQQGCTPIRRNPTWSTSGLPPKNAQTTEIHHVYQCLPHLNQTVCFKIYFFLTCFYLSSRYKVLQSEVLSQGRLRHRWKRTLGCLTLQRRFFCWRFEWELDPMPMEKWFRPEFVTLLKQWLTWWPCCFSNNYYVLKPVLN